MEKKTIKVLYFGNKLSKHGRSKSVIETIEPYLAQIVAIKTFSDKRNPAVRFADMIVQLLFRINRTDKVMIDVYSTAYFNIAYSLCALTFLFRKPYVLILHGGNLPQRFMKSESRMSFMLRNAHNIVAPSQYLSDFFQSKGFPVSVVPNIIDLHKFPFKEEARLKPAMLYIRGFSKVYNSQMAVKVIAELKKFFPDVHLFMIGSDLDGTRKHVEALTYNLGLDNNVEILGTKTQDEWVALANQCSVMISTPNVDNAPVSLVESMALGLPVVSTKVGGVPYIVTDQVNGILVEADDHKAMAFAVKSLLENPDLACSIRRNGRQSAEKYSWYAVKPQWEKILLS